ncbi:hypothetical protein CARUB_v10018843mg [Capsella rubella]|uniref:F-box domain-containing protein n=1 Tax=Capsella rubella TaxID=81985 RepID=R0HJY4_9BRAS|nr:putative F-box protein At2g33200 [Capsella rubella]EOA25500.1 hypothetical protein CARUB_v10018843mg [Capsella rubella]
MSRIRSDWSELCSDILRLIFEGLGSKDFRRARSVCSHWYDVSRKCTLPLYPWRILFKEGLTFLCDPGDVEENFHVKEHLGFHLSKSSVMASCSTWLLMKDPSLLYLLNVFTPETINLPLMESCQERRDDDFEGFIKSTYKRQKISKFSCAQNPACFWINERRRDYVVAWNDQKSNNLFTYKKGDDYWYTLEGINCVDMAYKDAKLYLYTFDCSIKIFDFSGDFPNEIIRGNPYRNHPFHYPFQPWESVWKAKVATTNSGDVLIVLSMRGLVGERFFSMFKMNSESGDWERVESLGGEVLIFGHGVTIKDVNGWGIKSDSICFGNDDLCPTSGCAARFKPNKKNKSGVFDLATSRITSSAESFSKGFWFVPGGQ